MNARRATLAVLTLALCCTLGACDKDDPEEAPATVTPAPAEREPGPPPVRISPASGPAGSQVRVSMDGLVLHAKVEVGFGSLTEHQIIASGEADEDGTYMALITIPPSTPPSVMVFFVADQETSAVISAPTTFVVTGVGGVVRVTGRITAEGVECIGMRGEAGELYTLTGSDDWPEAGTKVVVEGTVAETSICQQGLTLKVTSVRALP